ncbi:hypothetical protein M8818_002616 [Zalaria obscura]|uniref:Uncharacterized protein n=1 Tax=Zalaria obscura TaxID=2024903 RepID=A0ACC3SGE6_9PEZI
MTESEGGDEIRGQEGVEDRAESSEEVMWPLTFVQRLKLYEREQEVQRPYVVAYGEAYPGGLVDASKLSVDSGGDPSGSDAPAKSLEKGSQTRPSNRGPVNRGRMLNTEATNSLSESSIQSNAKSIAPESESTCHTSDIAFPERTFASNAAAERNTELRGNSVHESPRPQAMSFMLEDGNMAVIKWSGSCWGSGSWRQIWLTRYQKFANELISRLPDMQNHCILEFRHKAPHKVDILPLDDRNCVKKAAKSYALVFDNSYGYLEHRDIVGGSKHCVARLRSRTREGARNFHEQSPDGEWHRATLSPQSPFYNVAYGISEEWENSPNGSDTESSPIDSAAHDTTTLKVPEHSYAEKATKDNETTRQEVESSLKLSVEEHASLAATYDRLVSEHDRLFAERRELWSRQAENLRHVAKILRASMENSTASMSDADGVVAAIKAAVAAIMQGPDMQIAARGYLELKKCNLQRQLLETLLDELKRLGYSSERPGGKDKSQQNTVSAQAAQAPTPRRRMSRELAQAQESAMKNAKLTVSSPKSRRTRAEDEVADAGEDRTSLVKYHVSKTGEDRTSLVSYHIDSKHMTKEITYPGIEKDVARQAHRRRQAREVYIQNLAREAHRGRLERGPGRSSVKQATKERKDGTAFQAKSVT